MVSPYQILLSRKALKDKEKLKAAGRSEKARSLCLLLAENPFVNPPPYEKLLGQMKGGYSRRINVQHRLVYEVDEFEKKVYVLRMWTHWE